MPQKRKAPKWCYWRGDVLWFRVTIDSVEIRESLRTSSLEVARKRAEEIRRRAVGAAKYGEIVRTWEDAVNAWAGQINDTVGARTALRYDQSIRTTMPFFAGKPIHDIGKADVSAMVTARQRADISNATIRRDLTAIASVMSYAEDQDWRDGNPARDRARRIKEKRDPITLPPAHDIDAVIARFQGGLDDIADFARLTGMRLNEITSMQRRHFSHNARTLFVAYGKGRKSRTIELSEAAAAIIVRQSASIDSPLVFHHGGERYSCVSTNFARVVRAAQNAAQIAGRDFTRFRFHDLRHVFAVDALRSGRMGLYELSKHLGHSSVKTTEIYLDYLTPEESKAAKDGTKSGTRAAVSPVPITA